MGEKKAAVFCVGNRLMLDEGVGPAVYDTVLCDYEVPENVRLFDVGCMSLDMLPYVESYDVIITGRRDHLLQALAKRIEALGVRAKTLCFDVRDQQQVFDVCGSLEADWAEIDVLINNAGLALGLDPLQGGDLDDWNTMIDTNIKGLLYVSRALVPGMVERNRGEIINIGSVAGDAAYANGNVYCGTKAAVKMITDGLRIDTAHTRIRVTNIKPGLVETHFSNVRFHGDNTRAENVYKGIVPLTGADIADVAFYAASAPKHVQIAEVLVLATHQGSGSVIHREKNA